MKKLLLLLAVLAVPTLAQSILPSTAYRIIRGSGVPASNTCNTASSVGKVYVRQDAAAAAATLYVCSNTAAMTYAWELQGGSVSGTGCIPSAATQGTIIVVGASLGTCGPSAQFVITTNNLVVGATGTIDLSAMSVTGGLKLPSASSAAPTADGFIAVDTAAHTLKYGSNGTSKTVADTSVTTLSSLVSIGTISTGTWNATAIANTKGGTGGDSSAATGIAHVASGTWSYSAIVNADITNGTIAAAKLIGTDITTLGTVTTGTWSATTIALNKGGTGQTTQQAAFDALAPTATRAGDVTYWNGTHYVNLAGNNSGTNCLQENSSGVPTWAACGSGGSSPTATNIASAVSVTDSGSANSYAGCDTNSTAPVNGLLIVLQPSADNTGGSTYNHCTAGARPIQTAYGAAMTAGQIRADTSGSPSGLLLRYSSAANAGNGAWQNLTLEQVQLAPQTTVNANMFPRADGAGLTQWANPTNPGDGRRTSLAECNGRSWDLSNTALLGALFSIDHTANLLTGSASSGSGTQFPGCTITTGATSGNYVAYNIYGDDALFKTGRNLVFDTTVALSSTANTRNWIGLSACSAATDAGTATPCSTGFLGFRYDTGASDTTWRCIVATGSATNVDSTVSTSTNQVHLKFIADDTNNAVHFFIDGTEVCSATAVTNYPASTFLTWHITETTLTSSAKSTTMAYQWIQGDK